MPGVCNFCSSAKADECGICKVALCEKHVQVHSHGQGRSANGMSNKIRKVSFGVADATVADDSEEEASITAITEEVLMDDETQTMTRPEFLLDVS
jgi:hypothetical protein